MIETVRGYVIPAALALLPPAMTSPEASALLVAIGLQESRFLSRRQMGGPARGFWQFEIGGVEGVMAHPSTSAAIDAVLTALACDPLAAPAAVQGWLEHNDILAAAFARCLLYTLPTQLPSAEQPMAGWNAYSSAWRPGRPRLETWVAHYATGWNRQPAPLKG